jgi:CRP/FNR family cyclic AMP-dependent transcriptional regulator
MLSSVPVLACLTEDARRQVEDVCEREDYNPDERIIERGQEDEDVYLVLDGNVQILNYSTSGRVVTYAQLGPGEFFGELAAIGGRRRSPTVVATSP